MAANLSENFLVILAVVLAVLLGATAPYRRRRVATKASATGRQHRIGRQALRMPPLITATATDSARDSSEFSVCWPSFDDTIFADDFDPAFIVL